MRTVNTRQMPARIFLCASVLLWVVFSASASSSQDRLGEDEKRMQRRSERYLAPVNNMRLARNLEDKVQEKVEDGEPLETRETYRSLHSLFLQESKKWEDSKRPPSTFFLKIRGRSDGSIEVLNSEGVVLERYPLAYFTYRNGGSEDVIEKKKAFQEENRNRAEGFREQREKEKEDKRKAAEEAAARRAKRAEEEKVRKEEAWKATANTYTDAKTGKPFRAVKIDARKIGEGGTYVQDGKELKPIRVYNRMRGMYEMVVPVDSP